MNWGPDAPRPAPENSLPDLMTVIEQRIDAKIRAVMDAHERRLEPLLERAAQNADRLAAATLAAEDALGGEDDDFAGELAEAVAATKAQLRTFSATDLAAGHVPGSLELEVRATTLLQAFLDRFLRPDPR